VISIVNGLSKGIGRSVGVTASLVVTALGLGACGQKSADVASPPAAVITPTATSTAFYGTQFERQPNVPTLTELGRVLFADPALSASGTLACATCHVPGNAYAPSNRRPVQLGGSTMAQPGIRAVPSLTYHQDVPAFTEHFSDNDGNDSIDQGPAGGLGWDGRVSSAHEQAAIPLLSSFEMGNATSDEAVSRLQRSGSADRFRATFGDNVFANPALAWKGLLLALEVFQQSPADFYPYSSKYDAYLRGKATLSAAERHGLALFNDTTKGNCASCHPSAIKRGAFPQFTDHGFIALGVPRNRSIPANADTAYHDLGLCGPVRTDLSGHTEYCGLFETPSLRNVALKHAYFHNGSFSSLEGVVRFYAQRDIHPERYYPRGRDGQVRKFDDLPEPYWSNVNTEPPFGADGSRPLLDEAEIRDVVAFLRTLTDGYTPAKDAALVATNSSSR
jgi:cytochrome c peroxidase